MQPFLLTDTDLQLDAWGAPEDIGATTLDGPIAVSGRILFGATDGPFFGGTYAATTGRYRVTYGFHEHATLIEGRLRITSDASGETVTYGPGDSWYIAKGETVIWTIDSDRIVKSYLAATVG